MKGDRYEEQVQQALGIRKENDSLERNKMSNLGGWKTAYGIKLSKNNKGIKTKRWVQRQYKTLIKGYVNN